jgi:trehalose-6-phosphate synthase
VAEAIRTALYMSLEERIARWNALMKALRASDVGLWASSYIKDLRRSGISGAPESRAERSAIR